MAEIEFLDIDDVDEPPDRGHQPVSHRPGGSQARAAARQAAPSVLWALAAALSVAASFARVYSERIRSDVLYLEAVDGWGRYTERQPTPAVGHGTKYGLLLCAVAAAFLVAAVLHLRARRAALLCGMAGSAALTGCIGTVWLEVHTNFEAIRAAFDHIGGDVPPAYAIQLRYGALLWLAVAAVVAATLACAASLRLSPQT